MKRPMRFLTMVYVLGLIAFFALCILISGCSRSYYQARDVKRLDALFTQQPAEAARLANQQFPCYNGQVKSDTVTLFGPGDTVYREGQTLIEHQHDTTYITKHDVATVNKLITRIIHDTVPDGRQIATLTAQLSACNAESNKSAAQLADEQATAKKRLYWLIGLGAVIVAFVGIKAYLFFYGGGLKI